MFTFKQFTVHDEGCGMKVGTDGTLLGAWAPLPSLSPENGQKELQILDIGTGSGLIAMMLAQRCPNAHILAIDIDPNAARQAEDNFRSCPWSDRLTAKHISLQDLLTEHPAQYDLIVSNPPYFVDSLKNPDPGRSLARHTDTLPFDQLLSISSRLLSKNGIVALILPADTEQTIRHLAALHQLTPINITRVHTRAHKPARRILIALTLLPLGGNGGGPNQEEPSSTLCLIGEDGAPRSPEYQALTRDFYL